MYVNERYFDVGCVLCCFRVRDLQPTSAALLPRICATHQPTFPLPANQRYLVPRVVQDWSDVVVRFVVAKSAARAKKPVWTDDLTHVPHRPLLFMPRPSNTFFLKSCCKNSKVTWSIHHAAAESRSIPMVPCPSLTAS